MLFFAIFMIRGCGTILKNYWKLQRGTQKTNLISLSFFPGPSLLRVDVMISEGKPKSFQFVMEIANEC